MKSSRACYLTSGEPREVSFLETKIVFTDTSGEVANTVNLDQAVTVTPNGFVVRGVRYFWDKVLGRRAGNSLVKEMTAMELFRTYFIKSEAKSKSLERRA